MLKKIIKAYHNNKKQLIVYTFIGGFVSVLNIFLMWLFIDIFKWKTIVSGIIIVGTLYILKYILYKKTGFTQ